MWWNDKSFDKPLSDSNGNLWHFKIQHGFENEKQVQRIFYWNSNYSETGVIELFNDQVIHKKRILDRMRKITKDETYREKFNRELQFPIEKFW